VSTLPYDAVCPCWQPNSRQHRQLTVTEASGPVVRAVLPLTATQVNSKGTLHGSVTATIVDWIGGLCVASASADPASAKRGVSVDIHVSYIGGAKAGHELLIEGKADKVGRTLAFISVELRVREQGASDQGKLVAKGSHTKFVG
jgi:acyl-coenzyme A thioesterase 13